MPCLLCLLLLVPLLCCLNQVGPSCIMGDDCVVGDKTSVKRSVIGSDCRCVGWHCVLGGQRLRLGPGIRGWHNMQGQS